MARREQVAGDGVAPAVLSYSTTTAGTSGPSGGRPHSTSCEPARASAPCPPTTGAYYDAANGSVIWRHNGGHADVGRGMAGDVDPRFPGMEVWSFSGLYNAAPNRLTEPDTSLRPWPQLGLWWDGDLTMELPAEGSLPRLVSTWNHGAVTAAQGGPTLVGDILGDWREEAVYPNASCNELIIFTTNQPTTTRLYTPAHNPAYRNAMTFKGYMPAAPAEHHLRDGRFRRRGSTGPPGRVPQTAAGLMTLRIPPRADTCRRTRLLRHEAP